VKACCCEAGPSSLGRAGPAGRAAARRGRLIGAAILTGLVAKVLSESPWGPSVVHRAGWDIGIAPFAHACGTLAGLACALGAWALGFRIRPP